MPYKEDESKRGIARNWGKYSEDKLLCENTLLFQHKENNLPVTIVRPFYVYGPNNNLDRENYVFSRLLRNIPIIVHGIGKCKIQFGYIEDLCDAILGMSNTDKSVGEAYNIAGNEIVTFEEWIEANCCILYKKSIVK